MGLGRQALERLSAAMAVVAVLSTLGAVGNLLWERIISRELKENFEQQRSTEVRAAMERLDTKLAELDAQTQSLNKTLDRLDKLPDDAQTRALVATFDERVKFLSDRLKSIEDLITLDAQKALSLVMLRQEIEANRKLIEERLSAQNTNIDRLYNMFGWSIGALVIAIAAQILSGFLNRQARQSVDTANVK
jgi:hypothetical protein